ncbi:MAG: ddlA [Chitinophagaceae bacterium]|nr:ddlA [Chitinophagaceae bacterium]
MKIGIFFGGPSREREISFAGGRTVYDNLNKKLFTPVPVFVDSLGQFILLDWQYLYKGTVRDFYPPFEFLPNSEHGFQIYVESLGKLSPKEMTELVSKVGRKIEPSEFPSLFDFAFLALHGPYGEDGSIQGILEWHGIPYTGSGILPSAIGIDKVVQKKLMTAAGFEGPAFTTLKRDTWEQNANKQDILSSLTKQLGETFVVKAPHQGSSIGISVLTKPTLNEFSQAIEKSFFIHRIDKAEWTAFNENEKVRHLAQLTDIREGIGFPAETPQGQVFYHPEVLLTFLNEHFVQSNDTIFLSPEDTEDSIIIESFIKGQEFSCIVVRNENGKALALPPTGIVKNSNLFDYRSKYLPGMSRKVTPIDLPTDDINRIRQSCEKLFDALNFDVYARLDGFYGEDGKIFLNDPNTTSGMMPSSFFFHQAAEIGLNPSQFLTYIVRTSLQERMHSGKKVAKLKRLLAELDTKINADQSSEIRKTRIAVIMGGYSSERHISVESGRNIYEKLSSSEKYEPIPVFLTGDANNIELYVMPVNIMLKDNADDIKEKVKAVYKKHPVIQQIQEEAAALTKRYVSRVISEPKKISLSDLSEMADAVFIALHGRPGEDGTLQRELEKFNLPYNGSGPDSSSITINKYETNTLLEKHGILVAKRQLVTKANWISQKEGLLSSIEKALGFPLIAKPADDGCSSAVKKIKNATELKAYIKLMFAEDALQGSESSDVLKIRYNEEFPQKDFFLAEELVSAKGAKHFLEVTGGIMTRYDEKGELQYEIFEPSEALANGDILSLEEKFLAGEGQNITPARFSLKKDSAEYKAIAKQVKETLEKTCRILNVQGYARIDAFVRVFDNNKAETIVIEVNSLPGMTPATCIFHQTAINGYRPYDFIDNILTFGIERQKQTHLHA